MYEFDSILFQLIKFNRMEKFAKCTVQTGCLYTGSAHPDRRGPGPSQPFGPRQSQGRFSQLCRLQIPNRNEVKKNPRTYSIFESLMNFKRDSNLLEKSNKFSKIPS
jgi:hypothetical protein